MFIYEAEVYTPVPDQRLKVHVTAKDDDGARSAVRARMGEDRPIFWLKVRRPLADWEIEARGLKVEE